MKPYILILCLLLLPACSESDAWMGPIMMGGGTPVSSDNCTGVEKMGYEGTTPTVGTLGLGDALATGIFTAPCTGTLATAHAYNNDSLTSGEVKIAVFLDDAVGDGEPTDTNDVLIAKSASIAYADGGAGWYSAAFASGSVTKGETYWIVSYSETEGSGWRGGYNAGTAANFYDYDSTCAGFAAADNEPSEVTFAGACAFPATDELQWNHYVTLAAP